MYLFSELMKVEKRREREPILQNNGFTLSKVIKQTDILIIYI